MKIIILCGGSGTRLWPVSRERFPKQFVKINHERYSLFQETFLRALKITKLNNIYIVTNSKYRFLVLGELEELGQNLDKKNIISEPDSKNTLPAIYSGVYEISKHGIDDVLVMPSDHFISDSDKFADIVKDSLQLSKNYLVTFGVKPTNPNTGYGYISAHRKILNGFFVDEFKEKPDKETAKKYIRDNYYWNAGIFMFNSKLFINEVKEKNKEIYDAFASSKNINEAYDNINESISIDYGILEKSDKITLIPLDLEWSDLGSFESLYNNSTKDKNNNIINTENITLNSKGNYVISDNRKLISLVGIQNTIIIDNKDALLISKRSNADKVKEITKILKKNSDERLKYHIQDYRPWGYYTVLEEMKNIYKIKRIHVYKGKKLSLQSHKFRSEHWVVVRGIARVTIDQEVTDVVSGESIFIRAGQKHRLENTTNDLLEIIEVQMGSYLGEDDIVRYEDDFGRK